MNLVYEKSENGHVYKLITISRSVQDILTCNGNLPITYIRELYAIIKMKYPFILTAKTYDSLIEIVGAVAINVLNFRAEDTYVFELLFNRFYSFNSDDMNYQFRLHEMMEFIYNSIFGNAKEEEMIET